MPRHLPESLPPSPAAYDDLGIEFKRLGPLPIIRYFLDRLGVREIIDGYSPKPKSEVSNGDCVEALVMAIFLDQQHALSRVNDLLDGYDLQSGFRPGVCADHFHEWRLAECLDDLYDHAPTVYGDIVARAIREFKLVIKQLNLDATKILLYGDYACFEDYMEHVETICFPERGWNPEGRTDMKQLLFEVIVTEEKIPLVYALGDGNASETNEYLKLLRRLDTIQADISKALLAADSKLCAPATLIEAVRQGLRIVTLVPDSYSIREELCQLAATKELPVLLQTKNEGEYRGISFRIPHLVDLATGNMIETRMVFWRYTVIYSSQKAELEQERRLRETAEERRAIETKATSFATSKLFACENDAIQEANAWVKSQKWAYHRVIVRTQPGKILRGRGRPTENGKKSNDREGWGVQFSVEELPRPAYAYDPDAMFVLLSTVTDGRILDDTDILEGYKGRNVVEMSFNWLKGPAAVAPMFLHRVSRIQTMGFIFVLWMLVYALIQREIRKTLEKVGGKCPHPNRRWTPRPTTRGVLDILTHVGVIRYRDPSGALREKIHNWQSEFNRVLELIGAPFLYGQNSRGAGG